MKNSILVCTIMSLCSAGTLSAQGSRAASMEYLQSSSPLKTGGSVTAYSTPGTGVVTSIGANNTGSSATNSGSAVETNNRVASNPFPGPQPNPAVTNTPAFDPYLATTPSIVQLPTLGFTQNSSYRPSLFRNPWKQQQALPGLPSIDMPAASLAPQINPPGTGVVSAPALQLPPSNPVLLSGQNPPAIRYQNMPPGVYYGKGIFGQPKAYADGQPARNLLRFIFP